VLGRDPFLPLSQDEEGPLPNIENLQLVGSFTMPWTDRAFGEDMRTKAKAFALRENDPVHGIVKGSDELKVSMFGSGPSSS